MVGVRAASGHTVRAPRSVRQVGQIVRSNLRGCGHLWLRKELCWLDHGALIDVDDVAILEILIVVNVCHNRSVTHILEAVLIVTTRLTKKVLS